MVILLLVTAVSITSQAGRPARGPKRNRTKTQPSASPAQAIIDPAEPPSANLTRFIGAHMAALNDLSAASQPGVTAYRTDLSLLRAAIQAQDSAAPPAARSTYGAALRVCDLLGTAVDEHDKNAAQLATSQQVRGAQDIKDVRISTARARHGYGNATRANNAKEMAQNSQAGANEAFMNSALVNAWTTRLAELRQQIDAAYAQELRIEQQNAAFSSPSPDQTR